MANVNTSLIIVPRIARNKRIYSGSTVLSQSAPTPPPGSGTSGVTPTDGFMDWNTTNSRYEPYLAQITPAPETSYIHYTAGDEIPQEITQNVMIEGALFLKEMFVKALGGFADFWYSGVLVNATDSLNYLTGTVTGWVINSWKTVTYTPRVDESLPTLIGDNATTNGRKDEKIIVDPHNQRFDIDTTKTRLNKGTASKWLAIDANKEIEYKDEPVPYTGAGGNVDLGANNILATEFIDSYLNQKYAVANGGFLWYNIPAFIPKSGQSVTISSDGLTVTLTNPETNYQFKSAFADGKIIINGVERLCNVYTSTSVITVKKVYSTGVDAFPVSMRSQTYTYLQWVFYSKRLVWNSASQVFYDYQGGSMMAINGGGTVTMNEFIAFWANFGYLGLKMSSNYKLSWSGAKDTGYTGTKNTGIGRVSNGLLQVYDGVTVGALRDIQIRGGKIGTSYITSLDTATNNTAVTSVAADTSSFPATGTILIGGVTSVAYTSKTATTFVFASTTIPTYAIGTIIELTAGATISYTEFESDGTLKMVGNATVFDDLIADVTNVKVQGTGISLNTTESTVDYTTAANTSDYLLANYQMTHRWKAGSSIFPHIHWEQVQNNIPNWLIQYRWQRNGQAKTTAWTNYKSTTNAFTYVSGTLNQLSYGAAVTAPTGYSISDIIEFRVIRDTGNTSTLFAGADPYTVTASITSVDIHLELDTLGSRSEYSK